jgi:hypothetical protein
MIPRSAASNRSLPLLSPLISFRTRTTTFDSLMHCQLLNHSLRMWHTTSVSPAQHTSFANVSPKCYRDLQFRKSHCKLESTPLAAREISFTSLSYIL